MKFIIVSRLEKIKNVDITIKAFNSLKDELYIVGKGRYEKELKSLAKNNNIKFLGFVSEEKLIELFKFVDACIMPHIYEPFGLVPYEIAKFGKPSIVSELSGIAYLFRKFDCGLIFNPFDINDLIEKIKRIKDRKLYKKLSKNCFKMVKKINAKGEIKKFILNL